MKAVTASGWNGVSKGPSLFATTDTDATAGTSSWPQGHGGEGPPPSIPGKITLQEHRRRQGADRQKAEANEHRGEPAGSPVPDDGRSQ